MSLPFDYCHDPAALTPLSPTLRTYAQAKNLSDVAALRGLFDVIRQQRATQLRALERLAGRGNETAQHTLVAYYLDNAYAGTMLNTWCTPCQTCSPTETEAEPYAARAAQMIRQMLFTASADRLYALAQLLEDKRGIEEFEALHFSCLNEAARKGHAEAQLMLATLFFDGDIHMRPNHRLGLKWLMEAAEHNAEAAEWLEEIKHPPVFH